MPLEVLMGALLALATPARAPLPKVAWSADYQAAVRRYAAGERERAIASVVDWPEERLRPELLAMTELRRQARACADCQAAPAWRQAPIAAALMLHTDCAARVRGEGRSPRTHELTAVELTRLMIDDPPRRAFAGRWYGAMASSAQAEDRWDDALAWAERGLRDFPDSAEMLLVLGSIEEMRGALAAADALPRDEARAHYERAHRALRTAVAVAPELAEPGIRLGRVASRLGLQEEAALALEAVLSRRRDGPEAFLAFLFRGRLQEDGGRLEDAAHSYEQALSLEPRSQSARLALSHVRFRQGDTAAARREVETAMKAAEARPREDPFWLYPRSPSIGVEDRIEALRREASS